MMKKATTGHGLSIVRVYDASPEEVFEAWTDPAMLTLWWGPPGSVVQKVSVDLRVGGRYDISFLHQSGQLMKVGGIFEEIQAPERLAFTWRWANPDMDIGTSLVRLEFRDQAGKTALSLQHERLPSDEAIRNHEEGWVGILSNLERFLTTQ